MLPKIYLIVYALLNNAGVENDNLRLGTTLVLWFGVIFGCLLLYMLLVKLIIPVVRIIVKRTKTRWDDYILTSRLLKSVSLLIVSVVVLRYLPSATLYYPHNVGIVMKLCKVLTLVAFFRMLNICIDTCYVAVERQNKEIHGLTVYRNILQVAGTCVGILLILSVILNRDVVLIISGLGAMAAVLMLVFKDSILGLVAGLKLTINKMLSKGDWIIVPKYGANGVVEDVRLSTVKVRNWDNSVVTLPPYALVSEGFQNLEEMVNTGGRRIMRSVSIDINTIRKFELEEQARFSDREWAQELKLESVRYANVTLFRKYLEHKIAAVPTIVPDMLYMIRELQPTAEGLPIEIYLFTSETGWRSFESVQADLIDEVIASVGEFDLRIYQKPSFYSFQKEMSLVQAKDFR